MSEQDVKKAVRENYARIAEQGESCCAPTSCGCGCESASASMADSISKNVGYTEQDLKAVPEGANLGLGCGNPVALASLREGDIVLDLGSGAGFDCFLAADRIGDNGKVVGVDMTPEMIGKARENARKGDYTNVEFRLGEIENLPVADSYADVLISNCVINLVPDKKKVFKEAFRVLKPGGRLMISDIVLLKELPDFVKSSIEAYVGCIAGASMRNEYLDAIKEAGFRDVEIMEETHFPMELMANDPTAKALMDSVAVSPEELKDMADSVVSIKVRGVKQDGTA